MEGTATKRYPAQKLLIKDLLEGKLIEGEGPTPNYLQVGKLKVYRVNLMGVVVAAVEGGLRSIVIEDGSAQISIRFFDDTPMGVDVGDVVVVFGRVREYAQQRYITPEIVKKISLEWLQLRKKECTPIEGLTATEEPPPEDPQTAVENIIAYIRQHDSGDGVDIETIIENVSVENAEGLINHLIKQGDIFELRPGVLKLLE